jgi:prepilin-type N-terminal cleavage/methylation domain-containing protein
VALGLERRSFPVGCPPQWGLVPPPQVLTTGTELAHLPVVIKQSSLGRAGARGFSLVEMLVVVVILGALTLLAMPRIERALSRADVTAARVELANLILRARVAAVSARRPATLRVASGTAFVTMVTTSGTTQYVSGALVFDRTRVQATASASSITIQPTGLVTSGTPFSVRLSKRGITDSVTVSGYGRVQ